MIHDAQSSPLGYKLSIRAWPRDSRILRIAGQLGYRIPAPTFVAPEATPARALLNHGVWRAWCPDCPFVAEDVWRGHQLFWCMNCGNLKAGRAWRPLIWPENWQQIEADLDPFPPQAQNWEPWGTAVDHVAVAQEWVDHAGLMVDPEHGLTDNELGGADDPETYTTPVLAVTNAIIASSDANVDKGDIRFFRQFMSNNPGGANYLLISSNADAGSWVAGATAVAAALGYTPLNKAGDTMTNDLIFGAASKGVTFRGNAGATPTTIKDIATQGAVINAHTDSLEVYDQALANQMARFFRSAGVSHGWIGGNGIWHAGNDGAGSGLDADSLDSFSWKQGKTAVFSGTQALTTSYADVGSVSFSADRDGQWLILSNAEFAVASTDGINSIKLVAGGVDGPEGFGAGAIAINASPAFAMYLVTVSGATTIKVQAKKASGTGGSTINYCKLIGFWLAP